MNLIPMILAVILGLSIPVPAVEVPKMDGLTQMYADACMELWEKDSGLNSEAELLAFDFTDCNTLDQEQRELLMQAVGEALGLETREGTFAQLEEEGLIVSSEERPDWRTFPTGLLISLRDERQEDGSILFSLEKWRTPLGAYCLFECTAVSDDGIPEKWTYTVGAEMIS